MKSYIVLMGLLLAGCGGSGAPGATGAAGPAGASGPAGTNGTSQTLVSRTLCDKIDNGSGTTLNLSYDVYVYSGGGAHMAVCSVTSSTAQFSNVIIFKPSEVGISPNGECEVTGAGVGVGVWDFLSVGSSAQARQNGTGYTYTFASADCSTF